MKIILAAALLMGSVAIGVPSASACHQITPWLPGCWLHAFGGDAEIECFGCGDSTGTAVLSVVGAGDVDVNNTTAAYTVHEGTGTDCVIQGTADGTTSGALNTTFHWSRIGAVAVISTTGDVNGSGVAVFVAEAVGNPCGTTNLHAVVAGALAGS